MLADVHQHVWTRPLVDALAARKTPPFVRRQRGLGARERELGVAEREPAVLYAHGEQQPYVLDEAAEAPDRRAALVRADGLDAALVALSSPIGIEALPRPEADELIAAHLEGVHVLPPAFRHWGPVALDRPVPADVDQLLAGDCVGISLPAPALAGRAALEAAGPLLERAAQRGAPVFIHPGAPAIAGGGRITGHIFRSDAHPRFSNSATLATDPPWWPAVTDYVAQMQAAWLAFAAYGRAVHPELTVVFAMLAGGAPLLSERLEIRGGPEVELRDPFSFYDSSGYGPAAIEMTARVVGPEQLLYGSDRPVVEPCRTGRDRLLQENAGQLLTRLAPGGEHALQGPAEAAL